MYRYFGHAATAGKVKRAVAGLDFFSFNIYSKSAIGDLDAYLAVDPEGTPTATSDHLWLKYRNLLSADMIGISWATVRKQDGAELIQANGLRADGDIASDTAEAGGNRPAFEETVRTYYGFGYLPRPYKAYTVNYDQSLSKHLRPPVDELDGDEVTSTYAFFRGIVRMAYEKDIELYCLISPSHAWQWETLRAAGLWGAFEDWKRTLAAIIAEEAAAAGKTPYPLWDFADYSPPVTERVPQTGSGKLMAYYWESSHYRRELGNQVLNRLFGIEEPLNNDTFRDFGILLNDGDVEENLQTVRDRYEAYAAAYADDIARVHEIWEEEASKAE
jgi:hypothetical protein